MTRARAELEIVLLEELERLDVPDPLKLAEILAGAVVAAGWPSRAALEADAQLEAEARP